jgi:lysophospholipase L1-like esterase
MRNTITFACAVALAGCGGESQTPDGTLPAAESDTASGPVVFIGDSITNHWNNPEVTIPTLSQLVPGSIIDSYPGQTSVQIAPHLASALALHPSAVVIEAGTNDVIQFATPSIDSINTMAEEANAAGALVMIASIPATAIPQYGVTAADIATFNASLRDMCAAYGYTYLNFQVVLELPDGAENPADFEYDGIHPDAAGYAVMWPEVLHAIARRVGAGWQVRNTQTDQ